ncbi:Type I restriction-modification system DNA methylase [Neisseria gonorrhoeae]|uniref:Type I restriction-modification system DNA methylase n=1 Tax=Neisseria gonorrhoeae TaxID=485 RepID=A0A378VY49_NEIGO|nr:Type I restriction-modification system DNA methylase [Neisseria gonorrhoeae]
MWFRAIRFVARPQRRFRPSEKFDFIVSNPPFKLDFSDFAISWKAMKPRTLFAGIPKLRRRIRINGNLPAFIQHILFSLKETEKRRLYCRRAYHGSIGHRQKIREYLVETKCLPAWCPCLPIFRHDGNQCFHPVYRQTNKDKVVLIDASGLGEKIKDGKNQKPYFPAKKNKNLQYFHEQTGSGRFSVVVGYDEIKAKNHSLSAGSI